VAKEEKRLIAFKPGQRQLVRVGVQNDVVDEEVVGSKEVVAVANVAYHFGHD
jgi:hypothetical protein